MRPYFSACLFLLLPLALAPAPAPAQVITPSTGPFGGYVQDLAVDTGGAVYAATFLGGIYRTSDNGDLWEDLYNDTALVDVRTLEIPGGGTIYAGLDPGFMRSSDDGATWQKMTGSLNNKTVSSIVLLPNGDLLAATLNSGVYRSTNGGSSFSESNNSLTNTLVWSLVATPSGDTVYAGTYGGGVFRSIDAGITWSAVNTGLTQNQVMWVGLAPDGAVFACAGNSIFRSTNHGGNWTDLTPPSASYRGVAFTPGAWYAPATISVFSGGAVYATTDEGATWNPDPGLPSQFYISILAANGTVYAGAAGRGVYRRPAASGTLGGWTHVSQGMTNTLITSMVFDTAGTLFAGSRHAGAFRSADSGATWENISDNMPAAEWINDMAVNPVTNTVFAAGVYNSYRSTDGGDTWLTGTMGQLDMVASSPEGIVYSAIGSNILRSTDDGLTWSSKSLAGVSMIREAAFLDSTVYLATGVGSSFGTSRGVWRSTDNGINWAAFNDSLTDLNVVSVAVGDTSSTFPPLAGRGDGAGRVAQSQHAGHPGCDKIVVAATWNGNVHALDNDHWIDAAVTSGNSFRWTGFYIGPGTGQYFLAGNRGELVERDDILCDWNPKIESRLYQEVRSIVVLSSGTGGERALYGTMGGGVINIHIPVTDVGPEPALPRRFVLHQNYPNPFNPSTTIRFEVATTGHVVLEVFDLLGRRVATLLDETVRAGKHEVRFDAAGLPGGVYFCRMSAGEGAFSARKLVLLR